MSKVRVIPLDEWREKWTPVYHQIFTGVDLVDIWDNAKTYEEYERAVKTGIFQNKDWQMVAIPGQFPEEWVQDPDDPLHDPDDPEDLFDERDEFLPLLETFQKLDVKEVVISHAPMCRPEDIGTSYCTSIAIPPRRQNVNITFDYLENVPHGAFSIEGNWGLTTHFEDYTVLGGDADFMRTFFEVNGGEDKVRERFKLYAVTEWDLEDPEFHKEFYKLLGW